MNLLDQSLCDLVLQLNQGATTSVAVTQALIDRAQAVQPQLNCFVRVDAQAALQAAEKADAHRRALQAASKPLPPLLGVPLAHKDMFARQGRASGCGGVIAQDAIPSETAVVLQKLDAAGAFEFGALHMAEFAYGNTGHNAHLGACRNPWNTQHITGGSSSGSAASVAARANFAALGSDTGGSVRHPASFCGTVGIKTSMGAISTRGAMPLSDSLDTIGFLTRSVQDAALLFATTQTFTPTWVWQPRTDLQGLRIGVADNYGHGACSGPAAALMQQSLDVLQSLGARLVPITVPYSQEIFAASMTVLQAEATAHHLPWMQSRPQDYSPQVFKRLQAGLDVPAHAYVRAKQFQSAALDAWMRQVFSECDVLHAPVVTIATPTIAEADMGGSDTMLALVAGMGRWTRPINYLGLPALSLPAGLLHGLPFGLQLVAPMMREALLFGVGSAYEKAAGFAKVD